MTGTRQCVQFWLALIVILLTGCTSVSKQWVWEVGESASMRPTPSMQEGLNRVVDLSFDNVGFERVIDTLREKSGLNCYVNWAALEAVGIEQNTEVTLTLSHVTVAQGLNRILDELGGGETELCYEIRDNNVGISSKEDLSRRTIVRIYGVSDLLQDKWATHIVGEPHTCRSLFCCGTGCFGPNTTTQPKTGVDSIPGTGECLNGISGLMEIIVRSIDPESWRIEGGNVGTIRAYGPLLVIQQTSMAHEEIEALLSTLRQAMSHH